MMKTNFLPSYWDLLRWESSALFCTPEPQPDNPYEDLSLMSVFGACFLAVVPVGHLTIHGRDAFLRVIRRYFYFFFALFGRWNRDSVDAYDIFGQVERMAVDSIDGDDHDRNRVNLRYSLAIEATIAPRAILLQLFPWLTIWSVFSIATSRSAMWVRNESGLLGTTVEGSKDAKKKRREKKKKEEEAGAAVRVSKGQDDKQTVSEAEVAPPTAFEEDEKVELHGTKSDGEAKVFPWLITVDDAFKRAKQEDDGRWKKRRWITYLSAIRIIVLYSRSIQYAVSAYTTFISVWVLFHPANKAVLASVVLVLLPLAIVQALGVVLIIGKAMNVKDLVDVGNPGEKERKVIEYKSQGKAEKDIKAILVAELEKKKRKLRPLTVEEEEDAFDGSSSGEGEACHDDEEEEGGGMPCAASVRLGSHLCKTSSLIRPSWCVFTESRNKRTGVSRGCLVSAYLAVLGLGVCIIISCRGCLSAA